MAELALYAPDAASKNESIGRDAAAAVAASMTGHVGTALYVSPEMLNSDARYNQVCCYCLFHCLKVKDSHILNTSIEAGADSSQSTGADTSQPTGDSLQPSSTFRQARS